MSSPPSAAATKETRALPALERAWRRYRELSAAATKAERRRWLLHMGFVVAVFVSFLIALVAIGAEHMGNFPIDRELVATDTGKALASLTLIISLILLAYADRASQQELWTLLRSAAAEIEKDIYIFATILQGHEGREPWLQERLSRIRSRVFEGLGRGITASEEEAGTIEVPFSNLLAGEYLERRIAGQRNAQARQAQTLARYRGWMTVLVLACLGGAALVTALQGIDRLLVVLLPALALTLVTWIELRRLSSETNRSREVVVALSQIQDHWSSIPPIERTGARFYRLVVVSEEVLWRRHDDAVPAVRRTVAALKDRDDDLLAQVLKMPAATTLDEALQKQAQKGEKAEEHALAKASGIAPAYKSPTDELALSALAPAAAERTGLPHAFVVMPFGRKQSTEGHWMDFDAVYRELIQPALVEAGFEVFRADEESVSGDILTDMFQELLLADLVVADLSIDNANVFYELGVRHAMRKRGLIHIQSGRTHMPFDVFNVRTLPYRCNAAGKPDRRFLEKDRTALAKHAAETWRSDVDRVHSPIFNLLDGLTEPDRTALRTPLATGYWREYTQWQERLAIARRQKRIGDLLLLTEEVRNPLIKEEAIADAGRALRALGLHDIGLEQYRRGLELNPRNVEFRREEAIHLARLGRSDEAIVKLSRMLEDHPSDIESRFALGEVYEGLWYGELTAPDEEKARLAEAYESSHWLKQATTTMLEAYRRDQNHAFLAVKLLLLASLLDHVAGSAGDTNDPEVEAIRRELPALDGAARFTLESLARRDSASYSALIVQAYLALCVAEDPRAVVRAFKKALTLASKNRHYLDFTLDRLRIYRDLAFRPEAVGAAVDVLEAGLQKIEAHQMTSAGTEPVHIFLFAGHRIDRPGRTPPRFPADMEKEARQHIEAALDAYGASDYDVAVTAGACCGGDILFLEACLKRNMRVDVYLPCDEASFIEESVAYAGSQWVERYYGVRKHPGATFHLQPERVGSVPPGTTPHARNNRWALYSSLVYGVDRLRLLVLWDGQRHDELDGVAGSSDMVDQVRALGGVVEHVNTTGFKYWQVHGTGVYAWTPPEKKKKKKDEEHAGSAD